MAYKLYQVEEGEYKNPDKVYKVPVKTGFFYHFEVPAGIVGTSNNIQKNEDIDDHPGEYVETMKSGNEKEKIGVLGRTILIDGHIRSLHVLQLVIVDVDGFRARHLTFVFGAAIKNQSEICYF